MNARPEILRRAAGIIRTGGLAKGCYDDGPRHCTAGALMRANLEITQGGYSCLEVEDELDLLIEMLGKPWLTVSLWNDQEKRTAAEVIDLLEQAAEKAEAAR